MIKNNNKEYNKGENIMDLESQADFDNHRFHADDELQTQEKEQKELIIKNAIKRIESGRDQFLCSTLSLAIQDVLAEYCPGGIKSIQRYFPRFKQSTAVKYFNGRQGLTWWGYDYKQDRIRFLRYLLNGKHEE
jgi:hypothetical protein